MRIENSFIPARGVGEKTERRIWRDGVLHWDDFDPGLVGEKTGQNVSDFIQTAYEHLDDGRGPASSTSRPRDSLSAGTT